MHLKRNWCFSSYHKVLCQCTIIAWVLGELSAAIRYLFKEKRLYWSFAFDSTLWAWNTYRTVLFLPMSKRSPSCSVLRGDLILDQNLEEVAWARQTHWLPPSQSDSHTCFCTAWKKGYCVHKFTICCGTILLWRSKPSASCKTSY